MANEGRINDRSLWFDYGDSFVSVYLILIASVCSIVFAVGLRLIVLGIRAPGRECQRYCPECDQAFSETNLDICPECAGYLTSQYVLAAPPRRGQRVLLGLCFCVPMAVLIIYLLPENPLEHKKPIADLIEGIKTGSPSVALKNWEEVNARFEEGVLTKSQRIELIEICRTKGKPTNNIDSLLHNAEMLEFLLICGRKKDITFKQLVDFVEQLAPDPASFPEEELDNLPPGVLPKDDIANIPTGTRRGVRAPGQ